jgi:hypothetical protein
MQQGNGEGREELLDALFISYRAACPNPDASANFMPEMWARIEARENSVKWIGRMAKALIATAVAASLILGMISSGRNQSSGSNAFFDATFVQALTADRASNLEPFRVDRISELDLQ